jgi:hypothetical protein
MKANMIKRKLAKKKKRENNKPSKRIRVKPPK